MIWPKVIKLQLFYETKLVNTKTLWKHNRQCMTWFIEGLQSVQCEEVQSAMERTVGGKQLLRLNMEETRFDTRRRQHFTSHCHSSSTPSVTLKVHLSLFGSLTLFETYFNSVCDFLLLYLVSVSFSVSLNLFSPQMLFVVAQSINQIAHKKKY